MKIIIHGGMDKCGSTAIQAHFNLYRDWLLEQGVYIPLTCLTGFGHTTLFRDLTSPDWSALLEELHSEAAQNSSCVFMSWEGIYFYRPAEIQRLHTHLQDFDVTLLFYLRDQVDIIQSGYLERLKTGRQKTLMTDFNRDTDLLKPGNRDYFEVMNRFDQVFDQDALSLRVFDKRHFPENSIVLDALEALGLGTGQRVPVSAHAQNVSLDVASAQLLNVFDTLCDDQQARSQLVDEILQCIHKHGGNGGHFLDKRSEQIISEHYADSNARLKQRYGVNSMHETLFAPRETRPENIVDSTLLTHLAQQVSYPLWAGQTLEGTALELLTRSTGGWSVYEAAGVWSLGTQSLLSFRPPAPRGYIPTGQLRIVFSGSYFGENKNTELRCQDKVLGHVDLSNGHCDIPAECLVDECRVDLILRHASPQSPASVGRNNDIRLLAYQLASIRYEWLE